ncbi:MAG: alpha/beta hydrolase [Chloroflexi bacterium]|nr:alpha/beta hydrolase [Chloroflexota bacterium]
MPTAVVRAVGLNYDIVGDRGPWIMLIQGGRQDMELFRPLAENFAAAGYRVLQHDRRNSGASHVALSEQPSEEETFADDAHALCEQLGILPVIACGGAGGSRHCILMALRHPGSVRSLLIWWPSGGRPSAESLAETYYGQFITAARTGGMQAVLDTPYYTERVARVPENRRRVLSMDPQEFIAVQQHWRKFFLDGADYPVIGVDDATVASVTAPACIIPGHDLIHPHEIAERLARTLPNSEFHELEMMSRPEDEAARRQARLDHQRKLADIFLDFLSRHPEAVPT